MTKDERLLGFPSSMLATHTEARAVKRADLRGGDQLTITGEYDPCDSYQRAMRSAARQRGATINYWWPGGSFEPNPGR
jgi:hypothetical protein